MKLSSFFPVDELKLAKSSVEKSLTIVLLDVSFAVSFFLVQILFGYLARAIEIEPSTASVILMLAFGFVYYLVLLLAYSFFKFSIIVYVSSFFGKSSNFSRFWQFYYINIILTGIFLGIMIALNYVLSGIKFQYQPYLFIIFAVLFLSYLYFALNITHSVFANNHGIIYSLKSGFFSIFYDIKRYKRAIAFGFSVIVLAMLLFLIVGYLIRLLSHSNYSMYLLYYSRFTSLSIVFSYILTYLLVFFNRIVFLKSAHK